MAEEYTGGSVSYYAVDINRPLDEKADPYKAECQDIIDALGMDFNEGCAFKAIWRRAAARNLGLRKKGYDDGLYDAQKVEFYGARMVAKSTPRGGPIANEGWIEHDGKGCPHELVGKKAFLRRHNGVEGGPYQIPQNWTLPGNDWSWQKPKEFTVSHYRLA